MRTTRPLLFALLLLGLGCPPSGNGDDDDSVVGDDDDAADDDDSTDSGDDDDMTGDDDDMTGDDDDMTGDDDDSQGDDDDSSGDDDDSSGDDDDDSAIATSCDVQLEAFLADFATWGGVRSCGDGFLSIGNDDGSARVSVQGNLGNLSLSPGQVWTLDLAGLTMPPMTLTGYADAQRGEYLQNNDCVGQPPPDAPYIDRAFTGTGGFVTFTIQTVDSNGTGFTADVAFSGLVVTATDDANDLCPVPDRTVLAMGFGYWPA